MDLRKFVAFGSDSASTMVGSQGRVTARICNEVNLFLLSCHCVAHHINLTTLDVAKTPICKVMLSEVDFLFNSISSFLNKCSKHKCALTALQKYLLLL